MLKTNPKMLDMLRLKLTLPKASKVPMDIMSDINACINDAYAAHVLQRELDESAKRMKCLQNRTPLALIKTAMLNLLCRH
jgi:hypothetical protein